MLTLQNVKFKMSEYSNLFNFGFLNWKKLASFRGAYFPPIVAWYLDSNHVWKTKSVCILMRLTE